MYQYRNLKIKKFINEVEKLHFFQFSLYNLIITNSDRDSLIEPFINIPAIKNIDLTKHIDLMNETIDEMISPCFKGLSYNEYINSEKTVLDEFCEKELKLRMLE